MLKMAPVRVIQRLLDTGRPTAILWRVVTIVVDAVDLVFRSCARSHVFQEGGEGYSPALTNTDSPISISMPLANIRVRTALFHCLPNAVFGVLRMIFTCIVTPTKSRFLCWFGAIGPEAHSAILVVGCLSRPRSEQAAIMQDAQPTLALTESIATHEDTKHPTRIGAGLARKGIAVSFPTAPMPVAPAFGEVAI